jgi:hypothetical protein
MTAHCLVHHPDPVTQPDPGMELNNRWFLGCPPIPIRGCDSNRFLQAKDIV